MKTLAFEICDLRMCLILKIINKPISSIAFTPLYFPFTPSVGRFGEVQFLNWIPVTCESWDGWKITVTAPRSPPRREPGARGGYSHYLQDTASDLEEVIRGQIPGIYSASLIKGQTILNIQVL